MDGGARLGSGLKELRHDAEDVAGRSSISVGHPFSSRALQTDVQRKWGAGSKVIVALRLHTICHRQLATLVDRDLWIRRRVRLGATERATFDRCTAMVVVSARINPWLPHAATRRTLQRWSVYWRTEAAVRS